MKPMLFNTAMVKKLLDRQKTATRRVVKPQPPATAHVAKIRYSWYWSWWEDSDSHQMKPPYFPGDILYVRETWARAGEGIDPLFFDDPEPYHGQILYRADFSDGFPECKWRPSIHMPKEAARIFLQVTDVRVQQLKDVTEEDARAEGFGSRAEFIAAILKMYPDCTVGSWMWVIEFERITREEALESEVSSK